MPAPAPRILVIRRRYLGDLVLLGPFLRNLRLHWPAAHIAVLVEPPFASVLELNPDVNARLLDQRAASGWLRLVRQLRHERFTYVFDLENTERTALLTRLSRARIRVGLHHGNSRLKHAWCYTHRVNDPAEQHESHSFAEYFLRALAAVDVPAMEHEVRLIVRDEDRASIRPLLTTPVASASAPERETAGLLVHPGSRSAFRRWPAQNFAAVIDEVTAATRVRVTLAGGPAELEVLREISIATSTKPQVLDRTLTIPQFAALAAEHRAVLCHDSGPMHVAAAVGTRVVALFGSQNLQLWRPAGAKHELLQPPLPCRNCVGPRECVPEDSYHNYCVRNITVETVTQAVLRALDTGS